MKKVKIDKYILENFVPLTRSELGRIKGGSNPQPHLLKCSSDECSGYDPMLEVTYSAYCGKIPLFYCSFVSDREMEATTIISHVKPIPNNCNLQIIFARKFQFNEG